MKACVRVAARELALQEMPEPTALPGSIVVKPTLCTICGTDIHLLELPIPGITMGHEAVGTVHEIGEGVTGLNVGDRVVWSCLTTCGICYQCLNGQLSACSGAGSMQMFGIFVQGLQAELAVVPHANFNVAKIPDELTDEQVLFASDIMSTGFGVVERGNLKVGDTIAIFAQGPLGLCATAAAKTLGAGLIIGVESVPERIAMSKKMGASVVLNPKEVADIPAEVRAMTGGIGVDVAIEAVGTEATIDAATRSCRKGGTVSSLGVYSTPTWPVPIDLDFYHRQHNTTLCPPGKDRLRRLMDLVKYHRIDLTPLWTHRVPFSDIIDAYKMFQERRDGCIKIAINM